MESPSSTTQPLQNISSVIRQKEKELHEIHDYRCTQLEQLVSERDQLLLESAKRFDQLKEDFQYNLTLIEARDKEIERLETAHLVKHKLFEQVDIERRNLQVRVEAAEAREKDRLERSEKEKTSNKRILDELKSVIESMRWTADEESKAKHHQIESLKADIRRLNELREDALESQRRDLTGTFENILRLREEAFNEKEHDIGQQINLLDKRFEQLQTENTRLKNENNDAISKREQLAEELSRKEDQVRQLQWQLDDERNNRHLLDDGLQRKLLHVSLELTKAKEHSATTVGDLTKKLEQSNADANREKEFRITMEKRLEDVKTMAQQDLALLEREIAECRANETNMNRELTQLKEDRENALSKASSARLEADLLESRVRTLTQERDSYREEVGSLRSHIAEYEERMQRTDRELQQFREETKEREQKAMQYATEQIVASKSVASDEVTRMMREHSDEITRIREIHDAETKERILAIENRHREHLSTFENRLNDKQETLDTTLESFRLKTKELEETRADNEALKLRLRLQETQVSNLQQEVKYLQQLLTVRNEEGNSGEWNGGGGGGGGGSRGGNGGGYNNGNGSYGGGGRGSSNGGGGGNISQSSYTRGSGGLFPGGVGSSSGSGGRVTDNDDLSIDVPGSPAFSEDFGPVSLPESPAFKGLLTPGVGGGGGGGNMSRSAANGGHQPVSREAIGFDPTAASRFEQAIQHQRIATPPIPTIAASARYHRVPINQPPVDFPRDGIASNRDHVDSHGVNINGGSKKEDQASLMEENERLKAVVREMRKDLEILQMHSPKKNSINTGNNNQLMSGNNIPLHELPPPPPAQQASQTISGASSNNDSMEPQKVDILEKRLQQSSEEVSKLRQERKRLMDVGNELRSALNKAQYNSSRQVKDYIHDAQRANLDSIFGWLSGSEVEDGGGPSSISSTGGGGGRSITKGRDDRSRSDNSRGDRSRGGRGGDSDSSYHHHGDDSRQRSAHSPTDRKHHTSSRQISPSHTTHLHRNRTQPVSSRTNNEKDRTQEDNHLWANKIHPRSERDQDTRHQSKENSSRDQRGKRSVSPVSVVMSNKTKSSW